MAELRWVEDVEDRVTKKISFIDLKDSFAQESNSKGLNGMKDQKVGYLTNILAHRFN
jgi:hypothetical protein